MVCFQKFPPGVPDILSSWERRDGRRDNPKTRPLPKLDLPVWRGGSFVLGKLRIPACLMSVITLSHRQVRVDGVERTPVWINIHQSSILRPFLCLFLVKRRPWAAVGSKSTCGGPSPPLTPRGQPRPPSLTPSPQGLPLHHKASDVSKMRSGQSSAYRFSTQGEVREEETHLNPTGIIRMEIIQHNTIVITPKN